jgi:hypothetical protein
VSSRNYKVVRDTQLDFVGESYSSIYPNLHRYPATMIPQLGIEILRRLDLKGDSMLDPYCGSGSSFASGIHVGISKLFGFDLNPLAVLISKVRFTRLNLRLLEQTVTKLQISIERQRQTRPRKSELPGVTNIDYWFHKAELFELILIKRKLDAVDNSNIRDLCLLAFSETIRDVSLTRKNEFKLYRIPPEKVPLHKPDTRRVFLAHLKNIAALYTTVYHPLLAGVTPRIVNQPFDAVRKTVDLVLTSPPYGDSRTTVAYGQFSTLTNEWLGIEDARKIDSKLMGGQRVTSLWDSGAISSQLQKISDKDHKRALEVSSFYRDLGYSIAEISKAVRVGGYAIYIVGNRRVKDVQLSTDQFIAEQFERCGFSHEITFERAISSKSMPSANSPSNKVGATRGTMTQEFVVICRRAS